MSEVSLPSIESIAAQFSKPAPISNSESPVVTQTTVKDKLIAGIQESAAKIVNNGNSEPSEESESAIVVEKAAPAVKEPKDLASSKFAALSRREKEARVKIEAADRRANQLQQQANESEKRMAEYESRLQRYSNIKKDPLAVMREEGISAQDLMAMTLGIKEEAPVDPLDARFNSLTSELDRLSKTELGEVKQELERIKQREQNAALREVNTNIRETAKSGDYDYINAMGNDGYDLVREVMTLHYSEHKSLLTYDEACSKVEEYYEGMLEPVLKTKKVQSKFAPKPIESVQPKPSTSKEVKSPTTLTNSLSSASKAINVDKLTRNEALEFLAKKYNI